MTRSTSMMPITNPARITLLASSTWVRLTLPEIQSAGVRGRQHGARSHPWFCSVTHSLEKSVRNCQRLAPF